MDIRRICCPYCNTYILTRLIGKHVMIKHDKLLREAITAAHNWKAVATLILNGKRMAFSIMCGRTELYKCPGCDHSTLRHSLACTHLQICQDGKNELQDLLNLALPKRPAAVASPLLLPTASKPSHPSAPTSPTILSLPFTFTHTLTGRDAIRLCISTTAANMLAFVQPGLTTEEKKERRQTLRKEEWLRIEHEEAEADVATAWKRLREIGETCCKADQYLYLILSQRCDTSLTNRQAYQKSANEEIRELWAALDTARHMAFAADVIRDRAFDRIVKARNVAEAVAAENAVDNEEDDLVVEIDDASILADRRV